MTVFCFLFFVLWKTTRNLSLGDWSGPTYLSVYLSIYLSIYRSEGHGPGDPAGGVEQPGQAPESGRQETPGTHLFPAIHLSIYLSKGWT